MKVQLIKDLIENSLQTLGYSCVLKCKMFAHKCSDVEKVNESLGKLNEFKLDTKYNSDKIEIIFFHILRIINNIIQTDKSTDILEKLDHLF